MELSVQDLELLVGALNDSKDGLAFVCKKLGQEPPDDVSMRILAMRQRLLIEREAKLKAELAAKKAADAVVEMPEPALSEA